MKESTLANNRLRLELLRAFYDEDLERMSPKARAYFLERLAPEILSAEGARPPELKGLWAADYEREPVSVETFIFDDHFLGRSLKESVYPAIVDDLVELFEGDYLEVCLGGSWGWGKSREIEIGIAYEIYLLSCMREPASAFGLIPGSTMVFLNVSVDVRQAQRVLFGGLYGLLQRSPYFRHEFRYDHKLKSELRFVRQNAYPVVCRPVAASEQAILGEDVFSAALDEANFMEIVEKSRRSVPGETGIYDQAQAVADKLSARMSTRFNQRGKLPGHLWFASSARYPNDFTERKEAEAKTNPHIFARHRALWDSKPRSFFMNEEFPVEVGDLTRRTRVLDGTETDVTGTVIKVPMDFYERFLLDPDKSVRDLAGYSVLSINPFIPRREMVRKLFELGAALAKQSGYGHPFSRIDEHGHPMDVTLQGKACEVEYIEPERLHYIEEQPVDTPGRSIFGDAQRTKPMLAKKLFPGLYFAHVDLAEGRRDKCGVVITHVVGGRQLERMDSQTLKKVKENLAITRVDLALRIVAPPNGEVDIPSIRALFHRFRDLGMQFGKITFDQYQSQESIKALNDAGFTSELFSVDDENATAYEVLKQALYDQRVLCYEYPLLERELVQLERTPKKVDHPIRGSKDLADCLAAAVYHAEEGYRAGAGSLGLFQFGAVEPSAQAGKRISTLQRAQTKVVNGQPLTPEEENAILFGFDD